MDYSSKTKEDLIELLNELENKRAFSYEDRMKLAILDSLPFTIWASDKDCIIRLWEGRCEAMYGYTKNETLGKNFVDLFVAPDEKAAAIRDQYKIIEENKTFHNIANDKGRYGNSLHLITNCCRIIDPDFGDFLNAEMGVSIDYYEEEKQILAENIAEGKRIKSFYENFKKDQQRHKEQFLERCNLLLESIRQGRTNAASCGRKEEYREQVIPIERRISDEQNKFDDLIITFQTNASKCVSSADCEIVRQEYFAAFNKFQNNFSDLAEDIEAINARFIKDDDLTTEKDFAMLEISRQNSMLTLKAQKIYEDTDRNLNEYKSLGNVDPASERLKILMTYCDTASKLIENIRVVADKSYKKIREAHKREEIDNISNAMQREYDELKKQLDDLSNKMENR